MSKIKLQAIASKNYGNREKTDVNDTVHAWISIQKIVENQNYIFIYTAPYRAHTIPKKYFQNAEDIDTFFNLAKSYWERAKARAN